MTAARTVGASDVPLLLGLSPYRDASPFALWARLTGRDEAPSTNTAAQDRGLMLEPGILLRLAKDTGHLVLPNDQRIVAPNEVPWRHATPDGLLMRRDQAAPPRPHLPYAAHGCAEAKALRFLDDWGDAGTDGVRVDYDAQVRWQLACTQLPYCVVGAFGLYHDDWRVYWVKRDPEIEEPLVAAVRHWWDQYVAADVAPPYDDTEAAGRALSRIYSQVVERPVQATTNDLDIVRRLRTLDEHLEEARRRREHLRNQLRARIGCATKLMHGSEHLASLAKPNARGGRRRLTVIRERDHR